MADNEQRRPGEAGRESRGGRRSTSRRDNGPPTGKSQDLRKDLRDFASGRPQGWGHDDWLNFLESLRNRGHNVHDAEAIGVALEKERLDLALSGIRGMGPQRRQALVDRFGTVWNVRNADVDDIASTAKIPKNLAGEVKSGLT